MADSKIGTGNIQSEPQAPLVSEGKEVFLKMTQSKIFLKAKK